MVEAHAGLVKMIADAPGLVWRVWMENPATGEAGESYLFEDQASLDAYLQEYRTRLASFGITDVHVKTFDVNEPLSRITRGPVGGA